MQTKVAEWLKDIDIDAEFRRIFKVTLEQVKTIYLTQTSLTIQVADGEQNKVLQLDDPWQHCTIAAYLGYYWFKEYWIDWEMTCYYMLKRCSYYEPGLKRYVYDNRNNGCEANGFDPQRFWTFRFDQFDHASVNVTPFKQLTPTTDYVRFNTYVITIK